MKRNMTMRWLTFIVILVLLLMSSGFSAMAAKPVKVATLDITTQDFSVTLSAGEIFEFEVVAKYGSSTEIIWTSSEDLICISGPKKAGIQEKAIYRYTAPDPGETTTYDTWIKVEEVGVADPALDQLNMSFTVEATGTTNGPPQAYPLLLETNEDTQVTGTIDASDPDGDVLSARIKSQPANGTAFIDGLSVTYTPNNNFNGADPFMVVVEDGAGGAVDVSVDVKVIPIDDPPTAIDDTAVTDKETSVYIHVLNNDQDIDGGLFVVSISSASNGETVLQEDQAILYTPDEGFTGTDSFEYTLNGGSTATVTVTVNEVTAEPIRYVALGDSIPYGYYYTSLWNYLSGGTNSFSYVEQFADYLDVDPEFFVDASVSGNNTIDVYHQIDGMAAMIQEADVITLCVGANDVMDAVERNFYGLDKYAIDWAVADSGRDDFEYYWPRLIDKIENMNPDVTLIVMTVYNPYRSSDSYYTQVDSYFTDTSTDNLGLNTIIENTMKFDDDGTFWTTGQLNDVFDYHVVDIYETFNSYANKDDLTGFYNSFCDPHPTQLGQNIIFGAHQSVYEFR